MTRHTFSMTDGAGTPLSGVAMFARMLRAGLNLDQWPADALEREVARLLDIAAMELAPAGAAAALADAFEAQDCYHCSGCHESGECLDRTYPPRDLARERANREERQRIAGGTNGNAPAGLVAASGRRPDMHLVPLILHPDLLPESGVTDLDRPERGGRSAADLVAMHARTQRVSAGAEPAPPGLATAFEAPRSYMCARCGHHHAAGTFCGQPHEPHTLTPGDPDTCQCDTRDIEDGGPWPE